jgi:hypothetical protein
MKSNRLLAAAACLGFMAAAWPAFGQSEQGKAQVQTIVTVMNKNDKEAPPPVQEKDFKVEVNGKSANINELNPLRGTGLEMVVLIDGSSRTSLGRQLDDISKFVQSLPPNAAVGIAYMENGRASFAQALTTDKAKALNSLHLPGGSPGSDASPYFCLSDLAKNWPSTNRENRREVVMITDGVDRYNLRYDPDDPYVQTAINDSVRAGLVVYSIYWTNQGRIDRSLYQNNAGQSLLNQVTQTTGGTAYWEGIGNPVSFSPFFQDLSRRIQNQYELGFLAPAKSKPDVMSLKVKIEMPNTKLDSPQRVYVVPGGIAQQQ